MDLKPFSQSELIVADWVAGCVIILLTESKMGPETSQTLVKVGTEMNNEKSSGFMDE